MIQGMEWFKNLAQYPELCHQCMMSFSQTAEDIMVGLILQKETTKGLYVDLGAYHPYRFSNTFSLYLQGWRGINIDANPDCIELCKQVRSGDKSFQALVSDKKEEVKFYVFEEGAWNTTNEAAVNDLLSRNPPPTKLMRVDTIQTQLANDIFREHVGGQKFDYLDIDIEGMDERVLFSIDLDTYRPKVISIEVEYDRWQKPDAVEFLRRYRYRVAAVCLYTSILVAED